MTLFLLLLPIAPLTAHPFEPDSFEMRLIAQVPYPPGWHLVCGDADHDGQPEFYASSCAVEHIGANHFDTTLITSPHAIFNDIGDADRDGKTDLVIQYPANCLHVYESPDSVSLPTSCVWGDTVGGMPTFMYGEIADLDLDSACEIYVVDQSHWYVCVYENVADDEYELKTRLLLPQPLRSPLTLAAMDDLDRDGKPELAVGTWRTGAVLFYEAVSDDSLVWVGLDSSLRRYSASIDIVAAPDMDRDGRNEAIAMSYDTGSHICVLVLEAPCNDSFVAVWSLIVTGNIVTGGRAAVGDIDGDLVPEFAFTDGISVRLFHCTGNDQYEQCWQADNGSAELAIYDINADGKNELLYREGRTTVIRQYVSLGVTGPKAGLVERVRVGPTVAASGAPVHIAGVLDGDDVEVMDVGGRVVARPKGGVWNPRGVSPGAYFVRVRSESQAVVRKVLVLR